MDSLLKHIVDMSGHRDHTMLDISVISAVQELAGATQTRVLGIISVGFVSIGAQDAPVVILGQADQALYYAKSHGRNQTCHYDQLIDGGQLARAASNDTAEFF